jgi:arginine-tRNA-protein transferase
LEASPGERTISLPEVLRDQPVAVPVSAGQGRAEGLYGADGRHAGELNEALGRIGFRRSQSVAYRPSCIDCSACVSVRVLAAEFSAQRPAQAARRHADLEVTACKPWTTEEQYELLQRYLAAPSGGGMAEMDESDFADMVEQTPVRTYRRSNIASRREGRHARQAGRRLPDDQQSDGLSMIYSFFDVGAGRARASAPSSSSITSSAPRGRAAYVYLGYWVEGSPRMAYKTSFRPLERLGRDGWRRMEDAEADAAANALPEQLSLPIRGERKRR